MLITIIVSMIIASVNVNACVLSFNEYEETEVMQSYVIGDYIFDVTTMTPSLEDLATAARSVEKGKEVEIYNIMYIPAIDYYNSYEIFSKEESYDRNEFPYIDVTYLYTSHIGTDSYSMFQCKNENMLIEYLTLETEGESLYKTSATRGIEIVSDEGIKEIKYCFTSSNTCKPTISSEVEETDGNKIVKIEYPSNKEAVHMCVEAFDKNGNTSGIECDEEYVYVDRERIDIQAKEESTIVKEGNPESVSNLFDITYPVSGGKVYYYYYGENNQRKLLSSLSDLPSGVSTIQVIGRAGNGLQNTTTTEVTVEKYKVEYKGINEISHLIYNSTVDLSKEAPKAGYEFIGWSKTEKNQEVINKLYVTEDIVLYPVYKKEIEVEFEVQKKDGNKMASTEYAKVSCMIEPGENECKIKVPEINGKVGYEALGWNQDKSKTVELVGGETLSVSANIKYYSVTRETQPQTVTIHYYGNDKIESEVRTCYRYNQETECEVDLSGINVQEYR